MKYFTVRFELLNKKAILNNHLDGLSFSKIARKYKISKSNAWNICNTELKNLPDNNKFTFEYCSRFSNVHIPDGKYIHIKGYKRKIPLLWGIDYTTHDIPVFLLATSESFHSWAKYFQFFRIINHYPILIICDDNTALKTAARMKFPKARIQTCYNHFKKSLRRDLRVRTDLTYKEFSLGIDKILSKKRSERDLNSQLQKLYERNKDNLVCVKIIADIERSKAEFLAFTGIKGAPATNNIIECYNSHLEARLKGIRSFESFSHAQLWLNGYILKRRYTRFVGCTGRFKKLNGCFALEKSKKENVVLPTFF